MKKSAQILSVIFHPYLLPLYGGGMIVSYSFLEILPISIRLLIVSGIFLFSGILPMLFHLTLSLFYLNKSEKKPYVRLTEILLYTVFLIFATIYLHKLNLPYWTQGYLAGAALSSALTWIINISGWRISFFMRFSRFLLSCQKEDALLTASNISCALNSLKVKPSPSIVSGFNAGTVS